MYIYIYIYNFTQQRYLTHQGSIWFKKVQTFIPWFQFTFHWFVCFWCDFMKHTCNIPQIGMVSPRANDWVLLGTCGHLKKIHVLCNGLGCMDCCSICKLNFSTHFALRNHGCHGNVCSNYFWVCSNYNYSVFVYCYCVCAIFVYMCIMQLFTA